VTTDALLACGLLIPVTYVLLYVVGGLLRPGYSQVADSVSELLAPGSPNKPLLVAIQVVYAALHVLFGLGVLSFVQASPDSGLAGVVGAWMIVALGVATVGTAVFPQDAKGTPETTGGRIHKVLVFGALVPLSVLSTLLIGVWSASVEALGGFDVYSYVTVGAIVVMGVLGGAMAETRWAGLVERIAALTTHQWLFVLALVLLR
jgi:hypothetical protein